MSTCRRQSLTYLQRHLIASNAFIFEFYCSSRASFSFCFLRVFYASIALCVVTLWCNNKRMNRWIKELPQCPRLHGRHTRLSYPPERPTCVPPLYHDRHGVIWPTGTHNDLMELTTYAPLCGQMKQQRCSGKDASRCIVTTPINIASILIPCFCAVD